MNKIIQFVTSVPFMIMAALATAVASVDIYVPCMPEMTEFFHSSTKKLQLSMGMGVFGSSIATPFIGPLADSFGRRNLLICGHALYTLFLIASGFATNIDQFIIIRFCTGFCMAFSTVLGFTIIADKFSGPKVAAYYGYISTTITLTLVAAPLFGGYVADHHSWQLSFFSVASAAAVVSLLLFLKMPETIAKKQPFSISHSIKTYKRIISNPSFMAMALIPSIMIAGFVSFISCATFYYIKQLTVSATTYSLYQAFMMGCNASFSVLAGKSINRLGLTGVVKVGLTMFTTGGVSFLLASLFTPHLPLNLTLAFALFSSGIGFVFASISAQAMGVFPENAGATSSMITFLRGILITSFIYITSIIYNGEIWPVACLILTINILVLGLYYVMRTHSSN